MDPNHAPETLKHLEKQNELFMDSYRLISDELHTLQDIMARRQRRATVRYTPSTPLPVNPEAEPDVTLQSLIGVVGRVATLVEQQQGQIMNLARGMKQEQVPRGPAYDQFLKLQPPSFMRSVKRLDPKHWVEEMEVKFGSMQCSEEDKVCFATFMLKEDALQWWKQTRIELARESNVSITWTQFLEAFNDKYFPPSVREQLEDEFIELKQTGTVAEYEAEFTELSYFGQHFIGTEARKTTKFLRGLKPYLQEKLVVTQFNSYADAVDRARVLEQNCNNRIKTNDKKRDRHDDERDKRHEPIEWYDRSMAQKTSKAYPKCGNSHGEKPCYLDTGACFRCGKVGHQIRNCPEPKEPQTERTKAKLSKATRAR